MERHDPAPAPEDADGRWCDDDEEDARLDRLLREAWAEWLSE